MKIANSLWAGIPIVLFCGFAAYTGYIINQIRKPGDITWLPKIGDFVSVTPNEDGNIPMTMIVEDGKGPVIVQQTNEHDVEIEKLRIAEADRERLRLAEETQRLAEEQAVQEKERARLAEIERRERELAQAIQNKKAREAVKNTRDRIAASAYERSRRQGRTRTLKAR